MNTNLLASLKQMFGTVSGQDATGGTVALRNKTAYKQLLVVVEPYGGVVTSKTDENRYPRLVRVTVPE